MLKSLNNEVSGMGYVLPEFPIPLTVSLDPCSAAEFETLAKLIVLVPF